MIYSAEIINGEVENDTIVIFDENDCLVNTVDRIWAEDEHDWAFQALNDLQDIGFTARIQDLLNENIFPVYKLR